MIVNNKIKPVVQVLFWQTSAQYNLGEKLQLPSLIYTTAKDWEEKGIGAKGVSDSQKWEGKGWGLFVFLHSFPSSSTLTINQT